MKLFLIKLAISTIPLFTLIGVVSFCGWWRSRSRRVRFARIRRGMLHGLAAGIQLR